MFVGRGCRDLGLLVCALFFLGLSAHAGEPLPVSASAPTAGAADAAMEEDGSPDPPWVDLVATQHATISHGIIHSAAWIDSFFADGPIATETQQTRIKLAFTLITDNREGAQFDTGASFHLSLPMLCRRLQLQISDDGEEETAIDPSLDPWPPRDATERGVIAGVRYFFTQTARRNGSIKASLRFRDGNPALLLEPRYRQDFPFDPWLFRFTQRVIGYSNGDLQLRTILNLDRPLADLPAETLFRVIAEGIWNCERSGYYYHLDLKLQQKVSPRQLLEYAWINEFQTVPDHRLAATRVRVAYRRQVYRNWLFMEIAPQLSLTRDRDWHPDPSILLNAEIIFGAGENL